MNPRANLHILGCNACGRLSEAATLGSDIEKPGLYAFSLVYSDGFITNVSLCNWGGAFAYKLFTCPGCGEPLWIPDNYFGDISLHEREGYVSSIIAKTAASQEARDMWNTVEPKLHSLIPGLQEAEPTEWKDVTKILTRPVREDQEAYCRLLLWWAFNHPTEGEPPEVIPEEQIMNLNRLLDIQATEISRDRLVKAGILRALERFDEARHIAEDEIASLERELDGPDGTGNKSVIAVWENFLKILEQRRYRPEVLQGLENLMSLIDAKPDELDDE